MTFDKKISRFFSNITDFLTNKKTNDLLNNFNNLKKYE